MMCQYCDNVFCENVCLVVVINYSVEGLNQMIYNCCIGMCYCVNNCLYKVCCFNWLDYIIVDLFVFNELIVDGEDVFYGVDNFICMVLNLDVMVCFCGVIEKCSFCVQCI